MCPAVTALEFDGDKDKSCYLTPSKFKLSLLVNNLHCSKPDIVISRFLAQANTKHFATEFAGSRLLVRSFQEDTISTKLGVLVFLAVDEGVQEVKQPSDQLSFLAPSLPSLK